MPSTVIWSKSKPEIKCKYGGRLFFQTGSMLMKFGLLVDVDLWKGVTSSSTKPEVVWSRRGRHLEIVYDVITPPRVTRFGRNLVA